ncbi:dnaJ homolog dnj-5 isoform X2 [Hyalella azteca]|uniref:DnaJ homolog dnj-5 isoform X2 n=1 Tax=Hyalella azteca TaxID=294128 RepID=A0A8B7PHE6_HYAAZ|nr:dnaJ homolog dnj-5 isoform X2 [Hyalella azteca]
MSQNQSHHPMNPAVRQASSSGVNPASPPEASAASPAPVINSSAGGSSTSGLSFGTDLGHLLCDTSNGWSTATSASNVYNFMSSQDTGGHPPLVPQPYINQPLQQQASFLEEIIPYLPRNIWENPASRYNILNSLVTLTPEEHQQLIILLQQQYIESQQQQTHSNLGLGPDSSLAGHGNLIDTIHPNLHGMTGGNSLAENLIQVHHSFSVSQDAYESGLGPATALGNIGGPLNRSSSDLGSRFNSFHLDLGNLTSTEGPNTSTVENSGTTSQSVFPHHQQLGQLPMSSNFQPCSSLYTQTCHSSSEMLATAALDQSTLPNISLNNIGVLTEDLQRAPGTPLSHTPPPKNANDLAAQCVQNGKFLVNDKMQDLSTLSGHNSSTSNVSKSKKNKKNKNGTESLNKCNLQSHSSEHPMNSSKIYPQALNSDTGTVHQTAAPQQFSFYSSDQNILEKMGNLSSSFVNWISRDNSRLSKAADEVSNDVSALKTDLPDACSKISSAKRNTNSSAFVPCNFVNPEAKMAAGNSGNSNKLSYSDVLSSSKAANEMSTKTSMNSSSSSSLSSRKYYVENTSTNTSVPVVVPVSNALNSIKRSKNTSSSSPSLSTKSKKPVNPVFGSRVGLDEFVYPTVEELVSSYRVLDSLNSTSSACLDTKSTSPKSKPGKFDRSANSTENSEEESSVSEVPVKVKTKVTPPTGPVLNNNNNKIYNQKQNLKKSSFINNLSEGSSSSTSATQQSGAQKQVSESQAPPSATQTGSTTAPQRLETSSEDDVAGGVVGATGHKSRNSFSNNNSNNNNNNIVSAKGASGNRNKGNNKKRKEPNVWHTVAARLLQLCCCYVALASKWLYNLVAEVILMSSSLFWHGWTKAMSFIKLYGSVGLTALKDLWGCAVEKLEKFWRPKGSKKRALDTASATHYLEQNIILPSTGDEAMKRLLACRGLNNYNILGVTPNASLEDIRRYYRRQAFLVHPDKNKTPGAEEAFKVLGHAFEEIGEPAKREAYDKRLLGESQLGEAWDKLADLLKDLERKLEESANLICCTSCPNKHKRIKVPDRPLYAARYCDQCNIRHGAKEGDIWAESRYYGLRWRYYACMEGAVYDITEWANCQAGNLKQLRANTHAVQYRIVAGKKKSQQQRGQQQQQQHHAGDLPTDPEIEEFFNQLYREKFSQHFSPPSSPPASTGSPSHSATPHPCTPQAGGDATTSAPRRRGDKSGRRQKRQ